MKGIFSPDNPVVRFFVKLGYIWYLDILWLVTSLPIFTIGASTTALLYSSMKLQKEEGYPTKNFFHSFKENFKQATGIWMIYLGVGALLAIDLIYWNKRGAGFSNLNMPWALSIAACILYGISLSYVFAIQSKFVNTVRNTILYSILLPYRNLKQTILIAIVLIAVIYFNVTTVFAVNFMTLNFGVGLIAYLFGIFFSDVFEKYIPKEKEDGEIEEET
ncbi:MAG: YesL family protein [Lachnospiraceae bacterium]|nr:YesL family protein [Lachnospiraceae bacterium]